MRRPMQRDTFFDDMQSMSFAFGREVSCMRTFKRIAGFIIVNLVVVVSLTFMLAQHLF